MLQNCDGGVARGRPLARFRARHFAQFWRPARSRVRTCHNCTRMMRAVALSKRALLHTPVTTRYFRALSRAVIASLPGASAVISIQPRFACANRARTSVLARTQRADLVTAQAWIFTVLSPPEARHLPACWLSRCRTIAGSKSARHSFTFALPRLLFSLVPRPVALHSNGPVLSD